MKLSKGAKIFTMDGQEIGRLSRFVLDPKTKNVSDIVFEHGLLTTTENVVPMRVVDHVDEAGIHLSQLPVDNPKDLPIFLEEEFVVTDERALVEMDRDVISADKINSYYRYPPTPLGQANMISPNDLMANTPAGVTPGMSQMGVPNTGESPLIEQTMENIPKGTVAVKEGSKVYSSDGKHIGSVDKVFVDSNSGRMTHLIISKGLLTKERKQIPVDWISDIKENEVYLAVDQPLVDRLPVYQAK